MPTLAALIGTRIRQLREEQGIRATDLATYAGCVRSTISHIEAVRRLPSVELIGRFAEIFAIDEMDLFTFPGEHARHRINELTRQVPAPVLRECEILLRQRLREAVKHSRKSR